MNNEVDKKPKTANDFQQGYEAEYKRCLMALLPWFFIIPLFVVSTMYGFSFQLANVEPTIEHLPILFLTYFVLVIAAYIMFAPEKPNKNDGEITYKLLKNRK